MTTIDALRQVGMVGMSYVVKPRSGPGVALMRSTAGVLERLTRDEIETIVTFLEELVDGRADEG